MQYEVGWEACQFSPYSGGYYPCTRSSQQEEDHPREVVDQEESIYKEEEVSRREV